MKKQTKKTNNQKTAKHSKSGLTAFIANNFKYILATIAIIIAIIAVFFGESKLILSDTKSANVNFNILYYRNVQTEERFLTLADAVANAETLQNSGVYATNTIQVINNRTETSAVTIPAGTDIVLDLNGKTVTYNIDAQSEDTSAIVNNGTLRITDSTQAVNEYNYTMKDGTKPHIGGTLTSNKVALTNNGTGTIDGTAHVQGTGSAINTIINDGNLTIDSGLVTSTQNVSQSIQNGDSNIVGASLTINGGTVISEWQCVKNYGNLNQESNQTVTAQAVKITGGRFEAQRNVIDNDDTSTGLIYITGGDIRGGLKNNTATPTVYNGGNGKIIIDVVNSANTMITDYSTNAAIYNGGVNGATGIIEIRKGTIVSKGGKGVNNSKSGTTLIIGTDEVAAGGTTSVSTTVPSITGATYGVYRGDGTFKFYDGVIKGSTNNSIVGTVSDTPTGYAVKKSTADNIETATLDNRYNVRYLSGNLIYGLDDCGEIDAIPNRNYPTLSYMKYSINSGVVTVTAKQDDGHGFTTGRVNLEANRKYKFSCTTDGTWGNGGDTVEAILCKDGYYTDYYRIESNENYEFTPTVSGTYWLRLDVNQNGKTYTFSNISIYEIVSTQSKTYGSTYGPMPTVSRTGYSLQGWMRENLIDFNKPYAERYDGTVDYTMTVYDANTGIYTSNGYSSSNHVYGYNVIGIVETNETYTISAEIVTNSSSGKVCIGCFCMKNGEYIKYDVQPTTQVGDTVSYTFTVPEGITSCIVGLENGDRGTGLQYKNIKLEKGSVATDYYLKSSDIITKTEDHDIYALWTPSEYTLTINPNGGTKNGSTAARTLGTKLIYDSGNWNHIGEDTDGGNATRTGYTLTGYYTAATGGTKVYNADGTCVKGTAYWSNTGNGTYIGTSNLTLYAQWTYTATPTITRSDYNTFTVSADAGSQYFISTSQSTKPAADASGWSTTASKDVSTSAKETWYVWVKDANGNVSANKATITNYKVTLTAGTGTTLTAKADTASGTAVTSGMYVLNGTPVFPTGALNTGYNTLVVKKGSSTITNGSSQTISADTTFTSSSTPNNYTLTINPNGGTYANTTSNSTYQQAYDTVKQVGVATPPANATITYNGNGGTSAKASDTASKTFTGWTKSGTGNYVAGSNASCSTAITRTIKTENGESYENFKYTANNPTDNTWYSIGYPGYTYTSGHKYQIRAKIRVNSVANGGNVTLRHARSSNDWVALSARVFNAVTNGWQDVVLEATFSGTTYNRSGTDVAIAPHVEFYTDNLKGTTASIDFDFKNMQVIDVTANTMLQSNTNLFWYRDGNGTLTANYSAYSQVTLPTATRTGYTFAGWYDAASGGNKIGDAGANYTPTGSKTIYAHWTANTYTVKYNGNGSTSGSTANSSHTYDTAKALTANGFTKNGYTFAGWSTSASDTVKVYDNTEYSKANSGASSSYQEIKQYTINQPFATGDVYQLEVDVKGTGTLTNYFYGASGYKPVASWTQTDGTTTKTGTAGDGNNGMALTSSWKHYTVRFTLSSSGSTTVNKYLLFRVFGGNTAYIKNVRFFKVSSSSTAYIDGQSVTNLTTTNGGTVNLYALWSANTYSIKFNANGGSGTMSNLSMTYGTAKNLTANTFTRRGYVFKEWNTKADGSGTSYTDKQLVNNLTSTNGAAFNLYAIWKSAPGWINMTVGATGVQNILSEYFSGEMPEKIYINGDEQPTTVKSYYIAAGSLVQLYYDSDTITDMSRMFYGCSSLTSLDVGYFDVASTNSMFNGCSSLTSLDLSSFDTSNVVYMVAMFSGCSSLTSLDLSGFTTSNAMNMSNMFYSCSSLTSLDLSGFTTSNAMNMSNMFLGCSSLTSLDLSSFDTTNVADMSGMFRGCSSLIKIYASNNFVTSQVADSSYMFENCSNIKGGAGTTYNSSYVDRTRAHIDGGTSNPGYFTAKSSKSSTASAGTSTKALLSSKALLSINSKFNNGDGSESGISDENNVEESDIMEEKDSQTDLESTTAQIAQIGETTYESLESAIQAVQNGEEIKLLEDIQLEEEMIIDIGQNIILNLNGKTISSTSLNTIVNNGILTITGTGIIRNEIENGTVIYNTGTLNLETGVITTNKNGGKAVQNVTENTSNSESNASANSNNGKTSGVFNMKAGKIVTEGIGAVGIYNGDGSQVTIEDGIIEVTGSGSKAIYNDADLEITGGKVIVSGEDAIGIYNGKTGKTCVIKLDKATETNNAPEIIVEAEKIEHYDEIKSTNQFKEQLAQMKPSYGIYNESKEEVQIKTATIKVERLKGVGIINNSEGTITLGVDESKEGKEIDLNTASPIIYAVADNTTALINSKEGKINFYDGKILSTSTIKNIITNVLENYEINEEFNSNNIIATLKLLKGIKKGSDK